MGLIDWLDKIMVGEEFINRCKNNQNSDSSSKKDDEYLHPSRRKIWEDARLYRIELSQKNQYNLKISKMLEEIEKKNTISRDKRGSIVALEFFPEIIKMKSLKRRGCL